MLCIPSELYFCLFDPLKLNFLVIVSVQGQVIMFDVKRLKTYKNESGEIYMGEIKILNVMGIAYCIVGSMHP